MVALTEQECTAILGTILESSPRVRIIVDYIYYVTGKDCLTNGVTCRPCKGTNVEKSGNYGYYDPHFKRIVICCDKMHSYRDVEETLMHELIHALDAKRRKKGLSILERLACSEIRASMLGQCAQIWPQVAKRRCVFNDAVASTSHHTDTVNATRVVSEVFETCYNDRTPFQNAQFNNNNNSDKKSS